MKEQLIIKQHEYQQNLIFAKIDNFLNFNLIKVKHHCVLL